MIVKCWSVELQGKPGPAIGKLSCDRRSLARHVALSFEPSKHPGSHVKRCFSKVYIKSIRWVLRLITDSWLYTTSDASGFACSRSPPGDICPCQRYGIRVMYDSKVDSEKLCCACSNMQSLLRAHDGVSVGRNKSVRTIARLCDEVTSTGIS